MVGVNNYLTEYLVIMQYNTLLRIMSLIILICVLLLYVNVREGYEDAVPAYCGTAGSKLTNGIIELQKNIKGDDLSTMRVYTESECNKLEGAVYNNGYCFKLKDKTKNKDGNYNTDPTNIDINYTEKCAGLNKIKTCIPRECSIDGQILGKMNKIPFTIKMNSKSVTIDNNTFRIYTKSECDKLKGQYTPSTEISFLMEAYGVKKEEIENIIKENGKEYGICMGRSIQASMICGVD